MGMGLKNIIMKKKPKFNIPKYDPYTGELNPYYEELTNEGYKIKDMVESPKLCDLYKEKMNLKTKITTKEKLKELITEQFYKSKDILDLKKGINNLIELYEPNDFTSTPQNITSYYSVYTYKPTKNWTIDSTIIEKFDNQE